MPLVAGQHLGRDAGLCLPGSADCVARLLRFFFSPSWWVVWLWVGWEGG